MRRQFIRLAVVSAASLVSVVAQAPAQPPPGARPAETDSFPAPSAVAKLQRTQHSIQINGKILAYTAIATYTSAGSFL